MANVFEALETEWQRLRRDRGAAASLTEVCRQAGGAVTLADVERYVRQAPPAEADQVLLALASRILGTPTPHTTDPDPDTHPDPDDHPGTDPGDDRAVRLLAARVMLQLLLPGTRKLARRWWALGDHDERAAAAVAAVYHHIRTYPLTRRPARVAANILMDAAYDLRRSLPRAITIPVQDPTTLHPPTTTTNHPGAATHDPNPAEELAHLLTDAIADGTLNPADAQLIARTRIAGHHINDIATEHNRTPRTMWHRRKNAETTLTTTLQPT
jgi:hypothetical protein